MKAQQKLYARLEQSERELREQLVPALRQTVDTRYDLFCIRQLNPFPERKHHTSEQGEALYTMAENVIVLASQLGENPDTLLASRVVAYFKKAVDLSDHHRGSPASLAAQFLQELQAQPQGPEKG
jgi:hypothetical protein